MQNITNLTDKLSEKGRAMFMERMVSKTFVKGQQAIDKGDSVSGAYFVISGALRVFTLSPEGKAATLYRIEPGETCVLALNSLFNDVLYPAWVVADEETTIGVLPGAVYRQLFSTEMIIQDITVRALSSAVFGLMFELEQRLAQTVEQRLANYLLLRASSEAKVQKTQQELASEIGTSREVIGRLMAQFAEAGLLQTKRGMVTLLDRSGLSGVVQG
ncbi:MAG: Crp/Fnr family transcriptional regulator [Rhodospirillales bacterium]|nr:Crp/Fnr family transcriptional regulator [Rhodospirillales bacterium]